MTKIIVSANILFFLHRLVLNHDFWPDWYMEEFDLGFLTGSTLYVVTDEELKTGCYYNLLWTAARALDIPRRKLPETISRFLNELESRGIEIRWPNGRPFAIPFIDDVFKDCTCRWYSLYLQRHHCGYKPKLRCRNYRALRLIDAYIAVHYPKVASIIRK